MNRIKQFEWNETNNEPRIDKDENLLKKFNKIKINFNNISSESGTMYITNNRVIWLEQNDQHNGYAWDFNHILLHAISKDQNVFPHPCIYTQMDSDEVMEVRFIPEDPLQLQEIFDSFSHSAMLNPDLTDNEDELGNGWITNEEINTERKPEDIMDYLDSILTISGEEEGQFDDAEPEIEESDKENNLL